MQMRYNCSEAARQAIAAGRVSTGSRKRKMLTYLTLAAITRTKLISGWTIARRSSLHRWKAHSLESRFHLGTVVVVGAPGPCLCLWCYVVRFVGCGLWIVGDPPGRGLRLTCRPCVHQIWLTDY